MRSTIDKAGRLVIPRSLRQQAGLGPGVVEVTADGAGVRVESVATEELDERGGRLVISASGTAVDDELIQALRDDDRR
jgi:bifunctional DNA-binding transcriptional regulator/antitoxin component of YhaV-PrlF toxin-antitoxin module